MTHDEAIRFFGIEDLDELEDAFDELFFEHKKYFLSKVPIRKLLEARYKKLIELETAATLLNIPIHYSVATDLIQVQISASILDTFRSYQQAKNQLKTHIANARSVRSLIACVENLLDNEQIYAQRWYSEHPEITNEVLVSKEVDPMDLLDGIQRYQREGGYTFEQLKNLENNPPEILIQEMKRLSLLFKKYK
jgi:hypothetical protein